MTSNIQTPWGPVGYITYKRCVDISAPVLCADLSWKPAGDLVEGDKLLAFDEQPRQGSRIKNRYLKLATVQHNSIEEAECVGVEIDTGAVFYCTPDHRWLVKMSSHKLEWREASQLSETCFGGPVFIPRVFGAPWTHQVSSYEAGYLGGAYDGEGSLDRTNSVAFTQVKNGMLDRVMSFLTNRGIPFSGPKQKTKYPKRQACFDVKVHGMKNIARLLGEVGSVRLLKKLQGNLKKKPQLMRCDPDDYHRVVRVFPAGKRKVAVLQTSSRTHFTWGFPTHNTYSRPLDEEGSFESFPQTISRVLDACRTQLSLDFTPDEYRELEHYMLQLKCSVAGRFLWQLGTKTVDKLGLMSLQNCATTVVNEPIRPFAWAFDALMLGCGVGYNIQREYVYELPKVKPLKGSIRRMDTKDADFIVPDSREGWVQLLEKTLQAHYETGRGFSYSTICIRGKGAPIKGFGGVASGPEELCEGITHISRVLRGREGKKIRPIDALDIMNIIGSIVVAGNVRRSAQIAIGDPDDLQFLNAKRWDLGDIPNWRAMSNNSVVCNDFNTLPDQFWQGYVGNGEPYGLINLKLSRNCGRLGDTQYKDKGVVGFNPCFAPGELITTSSGAIPIQELVGKTVEIWDGVSWRSVNNFRVTGENQPIKKITLYDGSSLRVTPYHSMILEDDSRVEARHLKPGDRLKMSSSECHGGIGRPGAYVYGFLLGDGSVSSHGNAYLWLYEPKYACKSRITNALSLLSKGKVNTNAVTEVGWSKVSDDRALLNLDGLAPYAKELTPWVTHYRMGLPAEAFTWTKDTKAEFLAGYFDADGTALDTANGFAYEVSSISRDLLVDVQTLLKTLGVRSHLGLMRSAGVVDFNDGYGEYETQDCWRLTLSQSNAIAISKICKFARLVSFEDRETTYNVKPRYNRVVDVVDDGFEDFVYCCTVPGSHSVATGVGVLTGQCAEQSLWDKETCCLAEVFLPNVESMQELLRINSLLYRINKHSLALKCHQKDTQDIVARNMRMGIGVTGYLQATEEQRKWLPEAYEALRAYDRAYSKTHGFNESIKLTTCKPSGTLSLLPGVTPGVHAAIYQYFIRRIQMAANSPLVKQCRDAGYHVEYRKYFDGTDDLTTMVVEFPCAYPEGTALAKDVSAVQQLEYVKRLQTEWSDNAVSCTVYYRKEELPEIKDWLKKNYNKSCKTLSFLLHEEHGFQQAPYEEISEEEYRRLVGKVVPITGDVDATSIETDMECRSGVCPVR